MKRWLPAILLLVLLVAFRVIGSQFADSFPNFQPLPAILLCGIVFLKGAQRWAVPLLAWLISDPLTSIFQGYPVFGWHNLSVLLGLGATALIALAASRRPTVVPVLASSVAAAVAFFFFSNLVSFAADPLYAKTADGFLRSQWTGPVGMIPTWVFLRNLVTANVLFTGLFLLSRQTLARPVTAAQPAAVRQGIR